MKNLKLFDHKSLTYFKVPSLLVQVMFATPLCEEFGFRLIKVMSASF